MHSTSRGLPVCARCAHREPDSCLSQVNVAEQSQQSDDDQIGRDDIVQQSGRYQNKHAGEQRYQWCQTQGDIHDGILCALCAERRNRPKISSLPRNALGASAQSGGEDRLIKSVSDKNPLFCMPARATAPLACGGVAARWRLWWSAVCMHAYKSSRVGGPPHRICCGRE